MTAKASTIGRSIAAAPAGWAQPAPAGRGRQIHFPAGLIGYPDHTDFLLLPNPAGARFRRLESLDAEGPCFHLLAAPADGPDADRDLPRRVAAQLGWSPADTDALFLLTIRMRETPRVTVNALAPLVVDWRAGLAVQWVLEGPLSALHQPLA